VEQTQQLLDAAWNMVVNNYLDVVAALVIFVVGRIFAGWARRLTRKALERGNVDATLVPFLAKLIYYAVLAVVVIAVLNRVGVATTSVVAIFGAAGLAVGLAMQGTLANFEVRDDGTIAPWLTFDRHLLVLRGLWEHQPSSRYPGTSVPTLLIAADTGDVAWTDSKHDAVDHAIASLPRGRAVWFSPAHHDVHAQQPDAVGDLLRRAATDPTFFTETP